jgi:signal transduction histidine kinase
MNGRLRRCLSNLMDNARRYGDGPIDLSLHQLERALEIRVEDRAPGIRREAADHVFEPYVRIETSQGKNTGGSGLGLSIARAVARHEGVDIRPQSRPGGGLSAILSLPCDAAVPSASQPVTDALP